MSGSGTQLGNAVLFGGTSLGRVPGGAWDPLTDLVRRISWVSCYVCLLCTDQTRYRFIFLIVQFLLRQTLSGGLETVSPALPATTILYWYVPTT